MDFESTASVNNSLPEIKSTPSTSVIQRSPNTFLTLTSSSSADLISPSLVNKRLSIYSKKTNDTSINPPSPPSTPAKLNNVRKKDQQNSEQDTILDELVSNSLKKKESSIPPLSIFTTSKNFKDFALRVGPLHSLHVRIEGLFLWENPTETLLLLSVLSLICLNPYILLFIPPISVIILIASNWYKLKVKQANQKPRKSKKLIRRTKSENINHSSNNSQSSISTLPDDIKLFQNLKFIQFTMGFYTMIHDNLVYLNRHINFSNPQETIGILYSCLGSILVLGIIHSFVPWNLVILVGIWFLFLKNSSFGNALLSVLFKHAPAILDLSFFMKFYHSTCPGTEILVECLENQRWWAGLGWVPHLLRSDRALFSDATGTISVKNYQELNISDAIRDGLARNVETEHVIDPCVSNLPWKWSSEWVIDTSWKCTRDGWVYSDHHWNECGEDEESKLTRSRRWIRKALLDDLSVVQL